jgi:glyoxylase-like metal-dependent hydrolase (beta-lactamase superfamily II)
VVIDPSRHVERYQVFAAKLGARIVRVLDTHVHADHLSGGPDLAQRTGAPFFVAAGPGQQVRHRITPLEDGEELPLGGPSGVTLTARVVATPGHTPGSTSYLVNGRYLLSGDTLFVRIWAARWMRGAGPCSTPFISASR